ncbi:triose-phosphate isomerase [Glaciecola sp. SC05]|uniref:triose-phosphate isomerase n=1 Tax=Glaciecola sp. SC05 TaxID=1987355 RepID=UPI0035289F8E
MSHVRKKMVAGNWKMNGNRALLEQFKQHLIVPDNTDVVLCPPAVYLANAVGSHYKVGAQNISEHEKGAHTGDISCSMLNDLAVHYVILGHSERRQDHNESNELVAQKVKCALNAGLTPIFCIGEPLEVRESGEVFAFVQAQIDAVVNICGNEFFEKAVIAYEPIWAIGTGKTASPEQAQEVHAFIRTHLSKTNSDAQKMQILYGGSVNADNAAELFAQADIDGGLIGGASLKVDDFNIICQAAG